MVTKNIKAAEKRGANHISTPNDKSSANHGKEAGRAAPTHERSRGQRSMYNKKPKAVYSALDLGTNNCRLLIATPTQDGFRVIDAFSRIVRLGEGLETTGELSKNAMTRAIESLKICASKIQRRQVTHMRAVATEACRLAQNSGEFIDRVREATGIALDIISSKEEARLAAQGCLPLFKDGISKVLVFDIGGGSTEVIAVDLRSPETLEVKGWISMPFGVVRLAESMGTVVDDAKFAEVRRRIDDYLSDFTTKIGWREAFEQGDIQLTGSSGTVTTMASVEIGLQEYDRARIDGSWLVTNKLKEMTKKVAFMDHHERSAIPCVGHDRADLLVPGCVILHAILDYWPINEICIADRGIREGVLRGLMKLDRQAVHVTPAQGEVAAE